MKKFKDKSLTHLSAALFYSALQAFTNRVDVLKSVNDHLSGMIDQLVTLWARYDESYKNLLKSELGKGISELDAERDRLIDLLLSIAELWEQQVDNEVFYKHGRHLCQVFRDFDLHAGESVELENHKIFEMEKVLRASVVLTDAVQAMGLTALNVQLNELNCAIADMTRKDPHTQIVLLVDGTKSARKALNDHYCGMIRYLNAFQELNPDPAITQAAIAYNGDIGKRLNF